MAMDVEEQVTKVFEKSRYFAIQLDNALVYEAGVQGCNATAPPKVSIW